MAELRLSGFQEAGRIIEAKVHGLIENAKKVLEQEVEELRIDIGRKFQGTAESDFAWHLKIENEGNSIVLYLPYNLGSRSNRKGNNVSARKKHNPAWPEFTYQPFQDALEERGYTNISPGRGEAIPSSGSKAPNIRITAKLPEDLLRKITRL